MPLREGLAEYALTSAFRDSRFRKIEESELSGLECGYGSNFEDASSYLDWTVGAHGIYITFPHPSSIASESSSAPSPLSSSTFIPTRRTFRQTYNATYLPEIAPEQGWDKIETIDSAIRKAGWDGPITEDIRRSVKVRRYQSKKCTVGWSEYVQWRTEHGGKM
ncbi:hypothetical protein PHLCEN_2v805 [Hermanssonia centrifuga]|uniref:AMMECR1 domain-containing protein n=1 Tax=Hermanssonia centrifuga TaxID=98765 RepID=A0A2R6S4X2_9APHY|nr:hypothetical protein PHLCEN_2v805 [Hermanssonia centrifuga]